MKMPNLKPRLRGQVTPPADMVECAKRSLSDAEYREFVARFPGEITPAKLVQFVEEKRDGTRV